ncbi:hypothetical protein [Actinophytocola oryzae]|uniref:Uncharacterized protein n=1 Tax=Actinophytocola oryzae TaxID=502181 RepID=A0A4R7UX87_9PSEU|nr:hypothetical protein [Actinophytocola oryzae]TDV41419.1 hypothetical protein CLV71_120109 [Actinophytocola oryzae]
MRFTDAKGREWTVEWRFAPWRRVLRFFALAAGRYRYGRWPHGDGTSSLDAEGSLVVLLYGSLLGIVLSPLTLLELLAQLTSGAVLAALRAAGLARYRVDVRALSDHYLHSETVLYVRGGDRAGWLTSAIGDERQGAEQAFRPDWLPDDVEVRTHRSLWQSTAEWV